MGLHEPGTYYYIQYDSANSPTREPMIRFRFHIRRFEDLNWHGGSKEGNRYQSLDALKTVATISAIATLKDFNQYGFYFRELSVGPSMSGQGETGHLHPIHLVGWSSHIALELGRPLDRGELVYLIHVLVENQFYTDSQEAAFYQEMSERFSRKVKRIQESRELPQRMINLLADYYGDGS